MNRKNHFFKRVFAVLMVVIMTLSAVPMSGFVGIELPNFSSLIKANAEMITTTITINYDQEKHLVGSLFAIGASYKSSAYQHNSDTITCKVLGDPDGLVIDGGISCLGQKEDGIISVPLRANKIGKYTLVINGPEGATDSIVILVTNESYNSYLAQEIAKRDKFLSASDTIMKTSDYGWMDSSEVLIYFNNMEVVEFVETMIIRILIEKIINEDNIYEMYAKAASLTTECISDIKSIYDAVSETATFDSITDLNKKNLIKNYINSFYEFDAFDILSSSINGTTTIINAAKQAAYYRTVADTLSTEQISDMLRVMAGGIDSSAYGNTICLAFSNVIDIVENTDIVISDYFAKSSINYGLSALKGLVEDILKALAINSLNAVAPGWGSVLSVSMTVYAICNVIDDLCNGKLESVEKSLSAVSALSDIFKRTIQDRSKITNANSEENSKYIVDSYRYLIAADNIALQIQKENISILSDNLLSDISVQPAISLSRLIKNIEIYSGKYPDVMSSTYLVKERYPVVLNNLQNIIDNEYMFLKSITEDYLYYSYGMELFEYTSDLWEITTRFIVTLDPNYSDDAGFYSQQREYYYEGEKVDERCVPFSRSGYEFLGWYTDSSCTNKYDMSQPVNSNLILYAKWEPKIGYQSNSDGTATITNIRSESDSIQSRNIQYYSNAAIEDSPMAYSADSVSSYSKDVATNESYDSSSSDILSKINEASFIVPVYMDNVMLTSISSGAVLSSLNSIYIPETIEFINDGAIGDSTVIYCFKDSYAHKYAESNGYIFVLVDCEDDRTVIASDDCGANRDNVTWVLYEDGELVISGQGEMIDYSNSLCQSWYKYRYYITSIIIKEGITSIGDHTFAYLSILKKVTIANSVTSIGDGAFYGCSSLTSITIPDSVTSIDEYAFSDCSNLASIIIPNSVTSIGSYVFFNCTSLENIDLGNSLQSIGDSVFYECKRLKSISIPASLTNDIMYPNPTFSGSYIETATIEDGARKILSSLFADASYLKTVEIPDSVSVIGECAFYNCTLLTDITMPDSIAYIGDMAFYNCISLENIDLGNSLQSMGAGVFYDCKSLKSISVPASLKNPFFKSIFVGSYIETATIEYGATEITDYLFCGAEYLKTVELPDSVISIGEFAFNGCTGLTSVTMPNSITLIGKSAFYYCTNLTSVTMSDSVTSIGDYAFSGCSSLASITIPSSVTSIGDHVFGYCSSLTEINVNENNSTYSSSDGILFNKDKTKLLIYPEGKTELIYIIPDSVISIGDGAFYNCSGLASITIPGSVTSIDEYAFCSCSGLASIIIPNSVTSIGDGAFYGCSSLASITIPDSVTSIGDSAFCNCSGLASIIIPNSVTSVDYCSFYGCENLKDVYYSGTQEQWEQLLIESDNECFTNARIHYNYGSHHTHTYVSKITKATTCNAAGVMTYTCTCGDSYTESIPKVAHIHGQWIVDKAATCKIAGSKHQICSVCGETIANETIAKTAHKYVETITKPTCTTIGYTSHKCSVCGNTYTDTVVKATGHKNKTTTTPSTTSADGKIVTTCTICKKNLKSTPIYKASSIKLSKTSFTYNGKIQKPTVTVKNSKGTALKNGTDYTVSYSSGCKNTGKYAVKVTFKGNYSGSKTLYFNILPSKTSKLSSTQTTTSIKATWKAVTGTSGYKVVLYSAKNKALKTVYTTKTSTSFTKLSKGTPYKVKVTAYKTIDGKKVLSSVYTLLTTATKPGTPTLKVTAGSKKATLSWNKQTGATGYVVYMATSKNGKYTKIATVKGKVSYTKTGLTKGKTYYFKVAAYETVGGKNIFGLFSSVKYAKIK